VIGNFERDLTLILSTGNSVIFRELAISEGKTDDDATQRLIGEKGRGEISFSLENKLSTSDGGGIQLLIQLVGK